MPVTYEMGPTISLTHGSYRFYSCPYMVSLPIGLGHSTYNYSQIMSCPDMILKLFPYPQNLHALVLGFPCDPFPLLFCVLTQFQSHGTLKAASMLPAQ